VSAAYDVVTQRILEALDRGVVPWRKPWRSRGPANRATGRPYRGVNPMLLELSEQPSRWWLTYRQAQQLGGQVRKGEKHTKVVLWKPLDPKRAADTDGHGGDSDPADEGRRRFMLRYYRVFNLAQVAGIDPPDDDDQPVFEPIEQAARIVADMPGPPAIAHGGSRAYYSPFADRVKLPDPADFHTPAGYYATAFHELVHSTGHKTRLDRDLTNPAARFGTDPYAREELIAEIGAAMLCAHAAIDNDQQVQATASYLANWSERVRTDRRLVVAAASRAQKAADLILDRHPDQPHDERTAAADGDVAPAALAA